VSKFSNWVIRTVTRDHMYICAIDRNERSRPAFKAGTLKVHMSAGGEQELAFDAMLNLDADAVRESDPILLEMLTEMWPAFTEERVLHPFKDGLSLCDISHMLRSETHGVSLLEFGQLKGWWRVVYDEHIACEHAEVGSCPSFCTVYIDRVNQPPKRPKKKRERLADRIKIKLPELALPRPGFALG